MPQRATFPCTESSWRSRASPDLEQTRIDLGGVTAVPSARLAEGTIRFGFARAVLSSRSSSASCSANKRDAPTGPTLMLSLFTNFENFSKFKPDPRHDKEVDTSWIR
jgi:hypothetical protein